MNGLSDRVAIVTGGAMGIGLATTQRLIREGARVVVVDMDGDNLGRVDEKVGVGSTRLLCLEIDITHPEACHRIVQATLTAFGQLDFLVNCAAAFVMRGFEATREDWLRSMIGNVVAPAMLTAEAAKVMAPGSAIVNVSSISGHIAQKGMMTYNTAKGAVSSMTRCMALELADAGVRVNAVNPGTVWTENNEWRQLHLHGRTRDDVERDRDAGGMHMLNRVADPAEIASAIVFLLSDDASFMTAENLMVDAGYTAM